MDISNAFDKLKQNGIKDKLLCLLIVLVFVGIPQGSNLGPLLFLIYINDLSNGLQSDPKLFTDDTSLFSTAQDITTSTADLNIDLTKIFE